MKIRPVHLLALAAAGAVAWWWLSRPDELEEGERAEELDARGAGAGIVSSLLDALPGTWGLQAEADSTELPPGAVAVEPARPPMTLEPAVSAPAAPTYTAPRTTYSAPAPSSPTVYFQGQVFNAANFPSYFK